MQIRRNAKMTSDTNMSSTSDIAFLLIIFFMVTSAFIFKDGLHMVLPSKDSKPRVVKEDNIATIEVNPDESILLNEKETDPVALEEALKEILEEDSETIVLIRVSSEVPYQRVITVIDVVKVVGAQKLSLRMI